MISASKNTNVKDALIKIILILTLLMTYSYLFLDGFYVAEGFLFIGILLLIYLLRAPFNLSVYSLFLLGFGMILHEFGMFGFYSYSFLPFGIRWDRITHFFAIFAVCFLIFGFFSSQLDERTASRKNIIIYLIVLLAACGAGAFIENVEFAGFLIYGLGEGGFRFGLADSTVVPAGIDSLSFITGGGYYDAMFDLYVNLGGAIAALFTAILARRGKLRECLD